MVKNIIKIDHNYGEVMPNLAEMEALSVDLLHRVKCSGCSWRSGAENQSRSEAAVN